MKIEQELHEKLCAYVLGELDGADRADVERELLRSPELRAERERLEGTIGAVRDAMQPAQTLTPAAKEALERAVRPMPIARFPWLQLAAGIGAVGLGWWIFARGPERLNDVNMARLESDAGVLPMSSNERGARGIAESERAKNEGKQLSDAEKRAAGKKLDYLGYAGASTVAKAAQAPKEVDLGRIEVGAPVTIDASTAPGLGNSRGIRGQDLVTDSSQRGSKDERGNAGVFVVQGAGTQAPPAEAALPTEVARVAPAKSEPVELTHVSYGGRKLSKSGGMSSSTAAPGASGPPTPPGDTGSSDRWRETASSAPLHIPGESTPSRNGLATGGDDFFAGLGKSGQASDGTAILGEDARSLQALGYSAGADGDNEVQLRRQKSWNELTPEEQARTIDFRCGTIVRDCRPRPNERPRDMFFRFWGDNAFEVTMLDKLSTFSADVDTASYALARRYLNEGKVPEKAQIRTEEFVNYFGSDVEAPRNATFSVHSDLTPSRFSADSARKMLRVVVRAKDVDKNERQPMHLTFVVDVSGSMKENERLETVKHALRMLVAQLDARDSIALVTFSNDAKLVLPMTQVVDRAAIEAAIAPLVYGGSTNSNAGLQLGYAQALLGLDPNSVNRVVFLSDGVANVGETDAAKILEGVKGIREKGIFLNTIGVGMNNHNDVLLEQLADQGDGLCNYVDSPKEIQRALVDRFTGAFQPVAKDVKIQVEFDSAQVMRYRLLGYENRAIADADFRNDAVDAGELGAGHQVTALYEIEPTGKAGDGPMATVRLRWKPIRAAGVSGVQEATEASFDVSAKSYQAFESSPPGHRRALVVAQFAEILRRSIHARGDSLGDLIREATTLQAQIPNDKDFAEFVALVLRAKDSILRSIPSCDELCQTIDSIRSNAYLGSVFQETGRDVQTLQEIEKTRRDLEERLRNLLRQDPAKLRGLGYAGEGK